MARDDQSEGEGRAVPKGRLQRMARFGGLAAGVAGNMASEGARAWARGERPSAQDLLLTPSNAGRVADQLSQLRGAAMKVGQLLSMDGGDLIPPELAEILAKLRQNAHAMPPQHLRRVLDKAWGRDWLRGFARFDTRPIAAASIGQVHRGLTKDGRDLAIKVQYPGVRESIDADVGNVVTLIRLTGLLPKGVNIDPLLAEAKVQLKEEADYLREGRYLARYKELLAGDDAFLVPALHEDLTTVDVLAMDYLPGRPIEALAAEGQDLRDETVRRLMDLLLRELFTYKLIQTDPNFANYLVQEDGGIVLLDFGATREVPDATSEGYKRLLRAAVDQDLDAARAAAVGAGITPPDPGEEIEEGLAALFGLIMEPMMHRGVYDFGASDLSARIRDHGIALRTGGYVHVPPPVVMFLDRKIVGIYLLAARLKARVDVGALMRPYL